MDQHFELGNFAGPLDLLLYLVQKEEMDIREVSLVKVCDQYCAAMKQLKEIDVDRAGEFLVMASTLMSIKARSLLPREEIDLAQELDPEEELIQRLLEYRQLKEATKLLDQKSQARTLVHESRPLVSDAGIPLEEVGLFHLVEAFRKVLQDSGLDRASEKTIVADRPLAEYLGELLKNLRASPKLRFLEVFRSATTRIDLIGLFLAILELIRARLVKAVQEAPFGEIHLEALRELPEKWEPAAELWRPKAPVIEEEDAPLAPLDHARRGKNGKAAAGAAPSAGVDHGEDADPDSEFESHASSELDPEEDLGDSDEGSEDEAASAEGE